ncbi:MAG: hypothetical protein PHV32_02420 [Eubacteriales bacterium]|nr:hypothetical protein [Eubacteriales bacterium]
MKKYLSHYTAAALWNIPYIDVVLGAEIAETEPIHFTVSDYSAISHKIGQVTHLCELDLPDGALLSINGKMIASPELVFLQLAGKLSIHRLILLGLQLCSHNPDSPSGAITTKQKLNAFISRAPGHRGYRKASRAIKYVEDGSASVMESLVYMILALPHTLGGYGLDGAVFNHEILLKDESGKRLGQKRCFADLYYKPEKLAIEYESFAFHNSPLAQGKDSVRSAALDRQGVEVMHLSTIQLYDKDACMDFAFNLSSRLGKRIQIRAKKFNEMHESLRELLPIKKTVTKTNVTEPNGG